MSESADTQAAPDPIRSLAAENAALVTRLRGAQIPQHVGMAAAARALAVDLPRVLMAQLEADLKSGALAKRWEKAQARATEPSAGIDVEPQLAALVMLLAEQTKTAGHYLAVRGEEWASDAYRLEGQAGALEAQSERLLRAMVAEESPTSEG
jgi:short subunit fatty acids transporter